MLHIPEVNVMLLPDKIQEDLGGETQNTLECLM